MSRDFDKILKENFGALFLSLSRKFLGFDIKTSNDVTEKLQTTIEREPDFLKKITSQKGEVFLLHLEFQTVDEKEMVFRMQEYHAILQRKFRVPIRQFVIYLGRKQPKMRSHLMREEQFEGFGILDLNSIPYQQFVGSSIPEEVLLGILGNFGDDSKGKAISLILNKLIQTSTDQISLERYIKQLIVFSRLRNLTIETKEIVNAMPIIIDVENDAFYKEGLEKGIEKGLEKGLEKGAELKTKEFIRSLLMDGSFTVQKIAALTHTTVEFVAKVQKDLRK